MSKRAVIYARYSSDRQRDESIEGQVRVCEDYAKRNDLTIIHIYADRAMTGRTDQRPEFQKMIQDAALQTFDVVLVYKLNRFARNRYDSAKYKHKLKKQGVRVISAMENIADDPSGILLESVIEGLAEYYSAELAENVTRGMTENALEGKWPGGTVPLGFKLDENRHLIIDEPNASTVRDIYQRILNGQTMASVIKGLNEQNKLTAKGKPFSKNSLRTILKNERYRGTFLWNGIRKENAIPSIIDSSVFEAVQKIMNFRKKSRSCPRQENYLLSGKLYCGSCGEKMVGISGTSKRNTLYYYYACDGKLKKKGCLRKNIRADVLEKIVVDQTTKILSNDEALKAIAAQAVDIQELRKESLNVQSLKNQIKDIEKKLKNCIDAVENGLASESIGNRIEEYEHTLKRLKFTLSQELLNGGVQKLTKNRIEYFFMAVREKVKTADRYKSILLSSLIRCVILYDDYIEIQYNYRSELPLLENPVRVKCSNTHSLVDHQGFEPRTP